MVDGHGAVEKEAGSGWEGQGVLNRKKILVGRVRVSKWGCSMVDGHGAFGKEEDAGWEGQGV